MAKLNDSLIDRSRSNAFSRSTTRTLLWRDCTMEFRCNIESPKKLRRKVPVTVQTQQSALEGMLNGLLTQFFNNALYIHTYLQEEHEIEDSFAAN
eukprot:scaffold3115_cov132-Skeletonema_menzelii.AAC.1